MSPVFALFAFAVGSAALAMWTYIRFPSLAPTQFRPAIAHVAAATVVAQLVINLNVQPALGLNGHAATLAYLFAVALPVLVYNFLAALWVFALLTGMLRAYR